MNTVKTGSNFIIEPVPAKISPMPSQKRGVRARRAILLELARREGAGVKAPTLRELAGFSGKSKSQGFRHLQALQVLGFIDWTPAVGRDGAEVALTEIGREVVALIEG